MAAAMLERANRDLADYLRRRFPTLLAHRTTEELLPAIRLVRDRAKRYGILYENDVATAMDLSVMYGSEFFSAEWAADILDMDGISGVQKMRMLRARVGSYLNPA